MYALQKKKDIYH